MARGTSAFGDLPVLGDGVDTNRLWDEFNVSIRIQNEQRETLRSFLSHPVYWPADAVTQQIHEDDYEPATEYGEPVGLRTQPDVLVMGYNFQWRDRATRFTWKFLAEATAAQVEAVNTLALEADNRQVFKAVMGAVFGNAARTNPEGMTVRPLWNGDGIAPPEHNGVTFAGSHLHYLVSGAATVDSQDLVDLVNHVKHHGYGEGPGDGRLLVFANPAQMDTIRGFRVSAGAVFDFIPSQGSPTYLTDQQIVGPLAPAAFGSIAIAGSFGSAWVAEHSMIPAGYLLAVVSNGEGDPRNVVGFREHARTAYRGLRIIRGPNTDYPLTESFYARGFGTGVRQRGAAAVMQITANAAYTAPPVFAGMP